MASIDRKTIGIILNVSSRWMGGVIYVINTIKIFNWLDEEDQPNVVLFYRKDLRRFVDEIKYPRLEAIEWEFPNLITGYLRSWLTGKNQFVEPLLKQRKLDAVFPVHDFPVSAREDVQMVSWYADLQHKHYPQFFTRKKLFERDARIKLILKNSRHLVVSSQAVLDDFHRFFKVPKHTKTHIFHFASVIDSFDFSSWSELVEKHRLPEQYFMVSNQFHNHKNHKVLLEALVLMKKRGQKPHLALTGKLPDDPGSPYIRSLHELIEENRLGEQVHFLGVLSRQEQLSLMRYARAVIQPSFFEGWSTVIEDAISLQTPVIASDLDVNVEQLGNWGDFFDPHSPEQLANILQDYPDRKDMDALIYEPYDERVKRAAENFISVFTQSPVKAAFRKKGAKEEVID